MSLSNLLIPSVFPLCSLQAGQLRVARSAESVVPPLPLTLGSVKEKQAFEREIHTVTVGKRRHGGTFDSQVHVLDHSGY